MSADAHGIGHTLVTIGGPILLALVILFAILRNRTSKRSLDRTEDATRDLYANEQTIAKNDKAV